MKEEWRKGIGGCAMYKVHMKLNLVKQALKHMNRTRFGDVDSVVIRAREALTIVQVAMHESPDNGDFATREKRAPAD